MTRALIWLALAAILIVYWIAVMLFGFEGLVAFSTHFIRIGITTATLIVFIQGFLTLFKGEPPPRRDYLLAGINFMLLSAVCFSFWNEAGRIFLIDTSVFTSPVSGMFSLMLVIGAGLVIFAPPTGESTSLIHVFTKRKTIALIVGAVISAGLVFVAPLLRP